MQTLRTENHFQISSEAGKGVAPAVKGKIMVMDDEKPIRMFASEMLRLIGYGVETVRNGEEAIAVYKNEQEAGRPFEAVILDINIRGGMGGGETIKRLIQINPDIKAIVSSGYNSDPLMVNFKEYGFRGALPKPYSIQELRETLSTVMATAPQENI